MTKQPLRFGMTIHPSSGSRRAKVLSACIEYALSKLVTPTKEVSGEGGLFEIQIPTIGGILNKSGIFKSTKKSGDGKVFNLFPLYIYFSKTLSVMNSDNYYVYMLTNTQRKILYTGVTNNLAQRIIQHWKNRGMPQTFTGKYYCYYLVYFEEFRYIDKAIAREKEIKGWRREKKDALINVKNPSWVFLNEEVCGGWPPLKNQTPPFLWDDKGS